METVKYLLVIILPDEETYGYLVLASVTTIVTGTVFYMVYAFRNWQGTTFAPVASSRRSDGNLSTYGGTDGEQKAASS